MKFRQIFLAGGWMLMIPGALSGEATLANGTAAAFSHRAMSAGPGEVLISGFAIKDAATFVLIRAIGPNLAQFGVANPATGTAFQVFDSRRVVVTTGIALNALSSPAREEAQKEFQALGAFALPASSADSYAYLCLNPGGYTVVAKATGSGEGAVLTEVYLDASGTGARTPTSFDSQAAAADFVKSAFAGGKQEIVRVGAEDVLVVQIFGSGVPVLSISVFRSVKGRWVLASERRPTSVEFFSFKQVNGDLVAVGERTREEWILLDL